MLVQQVRNVLCLLLFFTAGIASAEGVFDLLDVKAKEALLQAQLKAHEMGSARVERSHLLWAILQSTQQPELAAAIKQVGDVNVSLMIQGSAKLAAERPKTGPSSNLPPLAEDLSRFLRNGCRDSQTKLADTKISPEVILLAMVDGNDANIRELTETAKLDRVNLETVALARRGMSTGKTKPQAERTALDEFGADLTETARRKGFRKIVEGQEAMDTVQSKFLGRRGKGLAIVGRSGVGKSKMLEEIARLTALPLDQQPEQFRNRRIVVIDVGDLMAGASHHGDAEGRIKAILEEAKRPVNGVETLLVLDNVKAPDPNKASSADFTVALSRHIDDLPGVIITCEEDTWHNYVATTSLGRKLSMTQVIEPNDAVTMKIIRDHKIGLERMYGVKIDDSALYKARELSKRFYAEEADPRRTIRLLETTCERYRYNSNELRAPTLEVDEKILWVEDQIGYWAQRPESTLSQRKLEVLREDLDKLIDQKSGIESKFKAAKDLKLRGEAIADHLGQLNAYLEFAQNETNVNPPINQDTVRAQIEAKKRELLDLKPELDKAHKEYPTLSPTMSGLHIATEVARDKKIPVGNMLGKVEDRLLELEKFLDENLIGQAEAKKAIRNAVNSYFLGIRDPNKPFVIRFKGTTGVGKTELAKLLNQFLFGTREVFTINMADFKSEPHKVANLFGSPVGYAGHLEGGQLSNHVRKKPFSVVLLDEMDKAHQDVPMAFMRPFDDGIASDTIGRRIDYTNVFFIQTDNEVDESRWNSAYLNRIQHTIEFKPLTTAELLEVFDLKFKPVYERILDKLGITLELSDAAKMEMVREAESSFGARQIPNVIERWVISPIAEQYVKREFREGDIIAITKQEGKADFEATVVGNNGCGGAMEAAAGKGGGGAAAPAN